MQKCGNLFHTEYLCGLRYENNMEQKRKDLGNRQNTAGLDRVGDQDTGLLFPDDEMAADEVGISEMEMDGTGRVARKKSSDLQGLNIPESIEGSSEQLLISAGESLLYAESFRKKEK